MNLQSIRLTFRLNRFELLAFGGAIALFIVLTVVAAARIDAVRPPAECLAFSETIAPPATCEQLNRIWYDAQNGAFGIGPVLVMFLSFAAALFLGVAIVAREVERGTTRLAWSLSPSRTRWFLARTLPLVVAVAVATYVGGVAIDRYVTSTVSEPDLANSFTSFGLRGLLIASRAVFIFAVAVLVGAIVARALPAVIVSAAVAAILLAGGDRVHAMILAREAVVMPIDTQTGQGGARPGDMWIDQKFVLPDGSLVDYGYFGGEDPYDEFGEPRYPMVVLLVPGERYRFVEAREAAALGGGSLVALGLAAFVVKRRRPG